MKPKLNRELLPVKCHFFFFFAALGPLLPQMNVFGRQLGVSPMAMGLVTSVLPLLWALAKPAFGYLVDFFPSQRKAVFMMLICVMTGSFCGLWGIPSPQEKLTIFELNDTVYIQKYQKIDDVQRSLLEGYKCHWNDSENQFLIYLSHSQYINTVHVDETVTNQSCSLLQMEFSEVREGQVVCAPKRGSSLICSQENLVDMSEKEVLSGERKKTGIGKASDSSYTIGANSTETRFSPKNEPENSSVSKAKDSTVTDKSAKDNRLENDYDKSLSDPKQPSMDALQSQTETDNTLNKVTKSMTDKQKDLQADIKETSAMNKDDLKSPQSTVAESDNSFYTSAVFWWFVVLMCVGTVAFNVANCIGDAVCFDVLGPERASKYGSQRAWGTAGYGLTALLGGWLVDAASPGWHKDFRPAFLLAIVFTALDLLCCRGLKLPPLSSPTDAGKALRDVLRMPRVLVFIVFAVVAGTFDSFIIYYMFWFLEELAEVTGHSAEIKLIEGVVVAGQSFIGEIVFFHFSGKIIQRLGHGTTMSISLLCYGVRMMLVSFITNPWHLVFVESVMQGPTYALCYASIVGYAATVAPEGYSATVQGIVAGMDDGLGFAIGSLAGGQLYGRAGGRGSFRAMAAAAGVAALAHVVMRRCVLERGAVKPQITPEEGEKMLQVPLPLSDNAIYKDTVVPLNVEDSVKVSNNR